MNSVPALPVHIGGTLFHILKILLLQKNAYALFLALLQAYYLIDSFSTNTKSTCEHLW